MEKKSVVVILMISIFLIFSISLVSAGFWGDLWGKITGRVVELPDSCAEFNDTFINAYNSECGDSNYDSKVDVASEGPVEGADCNIDYWDLLVFSRNIYNETWCAEKMSVVECVDSDGGIDYYVKGIVNDINGEIFEDACITGGPHNGFLVEYSCKSDGEWGLEYYNCSEEGKICQEGICIIEKKGPDLIVKDIVFKPSSPKVNESVYFRITVKNTGIATDGNINYKIIVSKDNNFDDLIYSCGSAKWGLNADEEHSANLNCGSEVINGKRIGHRFNVGGTYYIQAQVDEPNLIEEENEDNNILKKTITIFSSETTCTDSDGGKDYYVKGYVSGGVGQTQEAQDMCGADGFLYEYYCLDDEIKYDTHTCLNGCKDGACIEETKIMPASCAEFNDIFTNAWHASCGEPNYDSRVDVAPEGAPDCYIDYNDLLILGQHANDEAWCSKKLGIVQNCLDGTNYGKCSTTKPKYCDNGNLIDKCSVCGCSEGYKCKSDGSCELIQIPKENKKDMLKYSDKEVFLVSDKSWKDVLPLVSLTTWTGDENCRKGYGTPDNVCVYPTLIYHEENSGFDVDSIIYFMQQYNPEKVTIISETPQELDNLLIVEPELGAGLQENQIQKINAGNYLLYWQEFKDIVYVEDNYELALLASTYASLINAPLIVKGTNLDVEGLFSNRNIICIGNVNRNCNEKYNLEQLQQKYIDETNTDKIILTNPDDLNIKVDEELQPEKSLNKIYDLYGKTSLAAPILASAKHEIILSTNSVNYTKVDSFIESKIDELYNSRYDVEYLTILASPDAIEMSKKVPESESVWSWDYYWSMDNSVYASTDEDIYLELNTGRIYSLTSSDHSAYVSRVLFHNTISKPIDDVLFIATDFWQMMDWAYTLPQVFEKYNTQSFIGHDSGRTPDDWKDNQFILYMDHGSTNWAGIVSDEIPNLDNSFVIADACLTAGYDVAWEGWKKELFSAHVLRKGGIGFVGSVTADGEVGVWNIIEELFIRGNTIGYAKKNERNTVISGFYKDQTYDLYWVNPNYHNPYILIGDPTLKLNIDKQILPDSRITEKSPLVYNLEYIAGYLDGLDHDPPYSPYKTYYTNINQLFNWRIWLRLGHLDYDRLAIAYPESIVIPEKDVDKGNSYFLVGIGLRGYPDPNIPGGDNVFEEHSFELRLIDKAVDLAITNLELAEEKEKIFLEFDIENIGNLPLENNVDYYDNNYGIDYLREGDSEEEENVQWKSGYFEINSPLLPGEKQHFQFQVSPDEGGFNIGKVYDFSVRITLSLRENKIIEFNYFNNYFRKKINDPPRV